MREVVKSIANSLAIVVMLPLAALFHLTAAIAGKNRVFPGFSQFVSLFPGLTGTYLRRGFYQMTLPRCGRDSCISFGSVFSHPGVSIGQTTYIGVGCMIGDVELQDDVLLGSHVSIINGNRQHGIARLDIPVREQPGEYPRITIGQDTWIGDRAIVMADVGKHCVIGAGSVVTKPLEDYAIAVGNPARVIGWRSSSADAERTSSEVPVTETTLTT